MSNGATLSKKQNGDSYFLSEILGAKVLLSGRKIGRLSDFVIIDGDAAAEVSHLWVSRPFGSPALVIPWEKVRGLTRKQVTVDIESVDRYVADAEKEYLLLKDKVLDKKVLDTEGREVEVVYDIKMAALAGKLYVTDVDLSRYGLFHRLGLKWFADLIYNIANRIKRQTLSWGYVQPLPPDISSFRGELRLKVLKETLSDMHPADLADIIEQLGPGQRDAIFHQLNTERASDTLEEIDSRVQRAIVSSLTKEWTAQLVNEMTPGQAADVLAVLPTDEMNDILELLREEHRKKIRNILEQHEEKIVNYATSRFLKFPPGTTVREAFEQYRRTGGESDVVMYLYVVDEQGKLLGVVDIRELIKASNENKLGDIMSSVVANLIPQSTLREASAMFDRYGFRAIPIVDEKDKILGVVPFRDMMNLKHRLLE